MTDADPSALLAQAQDPTTPVATLRDLAVKWPYHVAANPNIDASVLPLLFSDSSGRSWTMPVLEMVIRALADNPALPLMQMEDVDLLLKVPIRPTPGASLLFVYLGNMHPSATLGLQMSPALLKEAVTATRIWPQLSRLIQRRHVSLAKMSLPHFILTLDNLIRNMAREKGVSEAHVASIVGASKLVAWSAIQQAWTAKPDLLTQSRDNRTIAGEVRDIDEGIIKLAGMHSIFPPRP